MLKAHSLMVIKIELLYNNKKNSFEGAWLIKNVIHKKGNNEKIVKVCIFILYVYIFF